MYRFILPELRRKAEEKRRKGNSIGQIAKDLHVSKSTVHEWVKTIEGATRYAQLGKDRWIREIQPLGALGQRKKREKKIALIQSEVQNELKMLQVTNELNKAVLCGLYWAEGSKNRGMLNFANTDPKLMTLFITLLRRCFPLDEQKFRVRLHLHWYHKEQEVKKFWSNLLKVPEIQFSKTYRKKRSKERVFRKNFGGICFLRYNSDYLREQIIQYYQAFGEKITGKVNVPVA